MIRNRLGCSTSPLNERHKKLLDFLVLLKDKLIILLWPDLKRAIHDSIILCNTGCLILLTVLRFHTHGSIQLRKQRLIWCSAGAEMGWVILTQQSLLQLVLLQKLKRIYQEVNGRSGQKFGFCSVRNLDTQNYYLN